MQCDANMLVPDAQHPPADLDIDRGDNGDPCPEDEEYFDRQDASTMEEEISQFMDGMEAQERYLVLTQDILVHTWYILSMH